MHGASFPFGATGNLCHELSHNCIGVNSFGDWMHVVAVSRNHVIVVANYAHRTGHNGFLTNVKVTESPDFLLDVQLTCFFFKPPPQQHIFVPLQVLLL